MDQRETGGETGGTTPRLLVVMGVSGCGKSTVAGLLSKALNWPFIEGDALHPAANIVKMHDGIPLTDDDRAPWLAAIAAKLGAWHAAGQSGIVTCSALKRAYRTILAEGRPELVFIYLRGTRALLESRMAHRTGHFMPPSLLDSQLATLEPPAPDEAALTVDIGPLLPVLIEQILAGLGLETVAGEG